MNKIIRIATSLLLFITSTFIPIPKAHAVLTVPQAHPRLWFTPQRLAAARAYYQSNPFTPRSDDPQGNALRA